MSVQTLATQLLDVRNQINSLVVKADFLKEQIYKELVEANTGEVIIPIGQEEEIVVRNNLRFTKPFDKEGLVGESDGSFSKEDLDYAGIANLVSRGILEPSLVEKFQGQNKCQFVTVRVRKKKAKKVKR